MLDRVWTLYLVAVLAMSVPIALWGAPTDGVHEGETGFFTGLHVGLLAVLGAIRWRFGPADAAIVTGGARAGLVARTVFTLCGVPTVFLALGWILPAVHPEPFAWTFLMADRGMLGFDPTVALGRWLSPGGTEVLQLAYSLFYALPIAAVLGAGARGGRIEFEQGMLVVVFGFLLSYLGYLLWPTLPPYRFLEHGQPLRGLWLAESVRAGLDASELHRWNCFPSGHTMLSLLSLWVARQGPAWLFWSLTPVVAAIVCSTLALRYHYLSDVLGGTLGAVFVAWSGETWLRWRSE